MIALQITRAIKKHWNKIAFQDFFQQFSYKRLGLAIITLATLFDRMKLGRKKEIALLGELSFNWIVVYLTCIIRGIPLLILHPQDSKEVNNYWLSKNSINLLFTDHCLKFNTPFLGMQVSLGDMNKFVTNLSALSLTNNIHWSNIWCWVEFTENSKAKGKDFNKLAKVNNQDHFVSIMQYSEGAKDFPFPIFLTRGALTEFVVNIRTTLNIYGKEKDKCLIQADNIYFHVFSVLVPIIAGIKCTTTGFNWHYIVQRTNVERIFVESSKFEEMWNNYFDFLNDNFYMFLRDYWVGRYLIGRKIRKEMKMLLGEQVKEVIILNNQFPLDTIKFLEFAKLPISTTFGTLETGQLISYKHFKEKFVGLSEGKLSRMYQVKINSNNPTEVPGRIFIRKRNMYLKPGKSNGYWKPTDIFGKVGKDGDLIVLGHIDDWDKNEQKFFPESIERRFKSFPYIKECMACFYKNGIHLFISVDAPRLSVIKEATLAQAKERVNKYKDIINKYLGASEQIIDVHIVPPTFFFRTASGKIARRYYP